MSVVAAIRTMLDQGFSIEQALVAAEAFEAAAAPGPSGAALRQKRYREKQKASRVTSQPITKRHRDVTTVTGPSPPPAPSPDKEIPPTPPKENNLFPEPPPQPRSSSAREFDQFWAVFPNKVGKADASKAFDKASKRIDFATMMAGLHRYVSKTDDRPWCNPATWLNQDRWADAPAQQARGSPVQRRPTRMEEIKENLRRKIEDEQRHDGQGNSDREAGGRVRLLAGPRHSGDD